MADDKPDLLARLLPVLVLLGLVALLALGWFAFPRFLAYMQRQDCIASGRVNCGG
jgi:hypothetical protein